MENPSICGENKCENSYGTYTCIEPSTTSTTTTEQPTTISTIEESIEHNRITDESQVESDHIQKSTSRETDSDDENDDDDDDEEESGNIKSETEENVDTEINKIPEAPSRREEEEEKEIESEKVRQHEEDLDEENTTETRETIDDDIPEAVHISHSTPEPVESTTIPDSSLHIHSTTISHHYAVSETENESVENSANENDEDEVDQEEEYTQMHHQSSTVKSDLQNECDDGLRLDDTGNCIGKCLY